MYEVNVYSNKTQGKKTECKKILREADAVLQSLGFIRLSTTPVEMSSPTIYRLAIRYSAIISKELKTYRR